MTITTISPKNHYKKILAATKDKILDQDSCNWTAAYYTIKKYKLFHLKNALSIKLLPESLRQKKEDQILKLRLLIYKLKSFIN